MFHAVVIVVLLCAGSFLAGVYLSPTVKSWFGSEESKLKSKL